MLEDIVAQEYPRPEEEPEKSPSTLSGHFQQQNRYHTSKFDEYGFRGLAVRFWLNPPLSVTKDWDNETLASTMLSAVVVEWNLTGENDRPLDPKAEEDYDEIDGVLVAVIVNEYMAVRNLPLQKANEIRSARSSKGKGR